jgi:steroid delta-isomerase-like uncharacterized protein
MSTEKSRTFADRFAAIFNVPDLSIADEIFAPDFKAHLPLAPDLDREGWKGYVQLFRAGFPDLRMEVEDVLGADDKTVVRVTYHGTHNGEFQGVPATGQKMSMAGIGIFKFENGQVVENWAVLDVVGLMQQIGAIPAP